MPERNDWDKKRDREQEFDRERGGPRLDYGHIREGRSYDANRWKNEGRSDWEREPRGDYPRHEERMLDHPDDRRGRDELARGSHIADYGHPGDWGRQGSWGTYGNRPSFDRREEESHDREPPRGRFESRDSAGVSQYGGGMGGYSGGLGPYGASGRYAGRGPKNWQRPDERIKEDVNDRLTDHPHIDATEIGIQVRNGEVTIIGAVEDRRIKRMVEDLVEGVSGVKDIHNQLRASRTGLQPETEGGTETGSQNAQNWK